jgi:hypothetical protein
MAEWKGDVVDLPQCGNQKPWKSESCMYVIGHS